MTTGSSSFEAGDAATTEFLPGIFNNIEAGIRNASMSLICSTGNVCDELFRPGRGVQKRSGEERQHRLRVMPELFPGQQICVPSRVVDINGQDHWKTSWAG